MPSFKSKVPADVKTLAAKLQVLSYTDSEIGLIVATSAGLNMAENQIPWPAIYQASFDPPRLKISYQTAVGNVSKAISLNPILDPNDFPNLVRAKVTSTVIVQNQIEYQSGLVVTFSARRKTATELNFVVSADSSIDITEPQFQAWAKFQLAEFKETFGF
jgi:hypothetical protein